MDNQDPVKVASPVKEKPPRPRFTRGDVVLVRSAREILSTLDADGMLEGLPFMPEMLPYIGKRFKISRRIEKTCLDYPAQSFRKFEPSNVVFLEELRCSGQAHGGCQRGCMIFWKEAWLADAAAFDNKPLPVDTEGALNDLRRRLKTAAGDTRYICQSSRLEAATSFIAPADRLKTILKDVEVGNRGAVESMVMLGRTAWWKCRGKLLGTHPHGHLKKTPTASLNLQAGDWVEVKPYEEIEPTLDKKGRNRGMKFDLDMRFFCGKRFQVARRLDRMVREDSGQLLELSNTVILKGVNCQCIFATGGCPRAEPFYWREIWLRRVDA